jgi:hypothetical protein
MDSKAKEKNVVISKAMHPGPITLCWEPQREHAAIGLQTRVSWSAETAEAFHSTVAQTELGN